MHRPLTLAALFAFQILLAGCQTRSSEPAKLTTEPAIDDGRLGRFAAALPFDRASVGVRVIDLASGRELYAREPDRPMMPASNLKMLTTATALHLLGPDHTFDTFFV